MILLEYTETFEKCPNGCNSISYLNDDQEHKDCIKCGTKWNRIDNKIIIKPKQNDPTPTTTEKD